MGAPFLTLTTIFLFNLFLYLFICKQHTNLFILFYEVYISMRKKISLQSNIGKWTYRCSKIALIIQLSQHLMYIYISQFVPNLEDDIIPESINNVRIHLKTLPSYITGHMVPPTQCTLRPISVMRRLLDDIKSNSCVKYHVYWSNYKQIRHYKVNIIIMRR